MLSDERPMEHEKVDHEEVWLAIRYLDPDERDKDRKAKSATITAVLALLLTVCTVWVVLWMRIHEFQRSWGAIGLLVVATSDSEAPRLLP